MVLVQGDCATDHVLHMCETARIENNERESERECERNRQSELDAIGILNLTILITAVTPVRKY
ncbi:UNVERIFIED_CONTAM: hypothetical protein FKN15_071101 [Acipenser sinensis]